MAAPSTTSTSGLFFLGFLTLFLELVLIRYLAGHIWNLGFFPNLVLLAAFLGMGTGFVCHPLLAPRAASRAFTAGPLMLLALVLLVRLLSPGVPGFDLASGEIGGELFFTATRNAEVSTGYALFALWFFSVIAVFALISQYTAKLFRTLSPLRAYSLDIAGSCCGIVTFMALSWSQTPPGVWFLLCIPLFLLGRRRAPRRHVALVLVALAASAGVAFEQDGRGPGEPPGSGSVRWSPYQRVGFSPGGLRVFVNGISHQEFHGRPQITRMVYDAPHRRRARQTELPPHRRVLVIGAGGGNDVASALLHGAEHVDAVEIDPAIAELGRQFHPEHPYADPRVRLTVGDGRAFLTNARERYDLIVFALTDSLVKVSPMAQLRLENYLFTRESLARAFELLEEDGTLVLYNYYRRPWVVEKIEATARQATGVEPLRLLETDRHFAVVMVDRGGPAATPAGPGDPTLEVATDDWPFPYLQKRAMPGVYVGAIAVLLLYISSLFAWTRMWRRQRRPSGEALNPTATKLAFAVMGAAFLLLETKSVIQFSLLFGTTWLNNSLVFLGILLLVLAANWTAYAMRGRRVVGVTFLALLLASLATLVFPLSNLLEVESLGLRFLAASLLTFSPIFFANLLFSLAFREQPLAEQLFGWNLLGATLGGVLEYSSMALGYTALSVIVAACYCAAYLLLLPYLRQSTGACPSASRG